MHRRVTFPVLFVSGRSVQAVISSAWLPLHLPGISPLQIRLF